MNPLGIFDSSLYSFKYFKKYIHDKFGTNDFMTNQVVKNVLSSIEMLRN